MYLNKYNYVPGHMKRPVLVSRIFNLPVTLTMAARFISRDTNLYTTSCATGDDKVGESIMQHLIHETKTVIKLCMTGQ